MSSEDAIGRAVGVEHEGLVEGWEATDGRSMALYKLHLKPARRYSQDIDLVQTEAGAVGAMMDAIRESLTPWLGGLRWKHTEGRVTFVYRFGSEERPSIPLKLKVEINTREHFAVQGFKRMPFAVRSRWFDGACQVQTYTLEELLGTKLRALYQRKQGRDLFVRRLREITGAGSGPGRRFSRIF